VIISSTMPICTSMAHRTESTTLLSIAALTQTLPDRLIEQLTP
jgi:hypothetical protein